MNSSENKTSQQLLSNALCAIGYDALFVVASNQKFDEQQLCTVAERRSDWYNLTTQSESPSTTQFFWSSHRWNEWLEQMCIALAPIGLPLWLPMHDVLQTVTLEVGARGVRSLFTSKPSEKQITKTRQVGRLCMSLLSSIYDASDENPDAPEAQLIRRCVAVSLGQSDDDVRAILAEKIPLPEIDVPQDLSPKESELIVSGLWDAAVRHNVNPAAHDTLQAFCQRLGVNDEKTKTIALRANDKLLQGHFFGKACLDAIRYVLSDNGDAKHHLATTTAYFAIPYTFRAQSRRIIDRDEPVALTKQHALDRTMQQACLAVAWLSVLITNPNRTRTAELTARHDRVAADGGSRTDAAQVRSYVESYVDARLGLVVQALGL